MRRNFALRQKNQLLPAWPTGFGFDNSHNNEANFLKQIHPCIQMAVFL